MHIMYSVLYTCLLCIHICTDILWFLEKKNSQSILSKIVNIDTKTIYNIMAFDSDFVVLDTKWFIIKTHQPNDEK